MFRVIEIQSAMATRVGQPILRHPLKVVTNGLRIEQ